MGLKVVAAAIRDLDGTVFSVPPPGRHHDVNVLIFEEGRKCPPLQCQGFLLSDGTFASRGYAKLIAEQAGQQIERHMDLIDLYSEDVW